MHGSGILYCQGKVGGFQCLFSVTSLCKFYKFKFSRASSFPMDPKANLIYRFEYLNPADAAVNVNMHIHQGVIFVRFHRKKSVSYLQMGIQDKGKCVCRAKSHDSRIDLHIYNLKNDLGPLLTFDHVQMYCHFTQRKFVNNLMYSTDMSRVIQRVYWETLVCHIYTTENQ